ncbi:MAG: fluoride efflux transporter CrcB [Planctomycetales bacterium]|nr:fluoride efflux transporter CrcB [Planctomycetales bacterium]
MSNPWSLSLLVGLGGFAGSIARYGLSLAAQRYTIEWPLGTLAANVLGCLIIGVITALVMRGETLTPELRLALATGFCGGFTTLSSLIYETAEMIRSSELLHAALYVAGTLVFSMIAFVTGVFVVRLLLRVGGVMWS